MPRTQIAETDKITLRSVGRALDLIEILGTADGAGLNVGEIAKKAGHHARIKDGVVHIDAEEDWGSELNRLAFEQGIILKQITPVRPTLEETFFAMTEESR